MRFLDPLLKVMASWPSLFFIKYSSRVQIFWILLGLLLLLMSLSPAISGDGLDRYATLIGLVESKTLIGKFSLVQTLFSLPLYFIGKWFGDIKGLTAYFNYTVFTVTVFFCGGFYQITNDFIL